MIEVPKGRQIIATGVSPWVQRTRTISPAGAEDKTAADFRPVGAYLEYRPHLRLTPQAIVLRPFWGWQKRGDTNGAETIPRVGRTSDLPFLFPQSGKDSRSG